ncbi:MAG: hypothetical protein ACYDC0_16250 [Acidimicrobiales bacterium]
MPTANTVPLNDSFAAAGSPKFADAIPAGGSVIIVLAQSSNVALWRIWSMTVTQASPVAGAYGVLYFGSGAFEAATDGEIDCPVNDTRLVGPIMIADTYAISGYNPTSAPLKISVNYDVLFQVSGQPFRYYEWSD